MGAQPSISPLTVVLQPAAVASILDHATRKELGSYRVIGALLGTRSEDGMEVQVTNCFAIPHTESEEQVEVDVEYQKNMLALTLKSTPREYLMGWYTTNEDLNNFSALIQNFFASPETGTFPHPAIHLAVSTTAGEDIAFKTYISSAVGVNAERAAESCLFIPVPCINKVTEAERPGLEFVSGGMNDENRAAAVVSDIEGLERAVDHQLDLLDRVSEYVGSVLDEESEPTQALGQYLMNTLSLAPKVDDADIERDFNNHIQDVLVVSYLANSIRTQIDLSQRLATSQLTMGSDTVMPADKEGRDDKQGQNRKGGKQQGNRGGNKGAGGGRPTADE